MSDLGGEFKSNLEKEIMELLQIKQHYIISYHPQIIQCRNLLQLFII